MSDETICPDCGEEYASEHGVDIHMSQSDCGDDDEEYSELEQRVFDREDGSCKRCDDAEATVIHQIEDDDTPDAEIVNYAALCEECDDFVTGLASVTKRTVIQTGVDEDDDEDKPWYAKTPGERSRSRRRR